MSPKKVAISEELRFRRFELCGATSLAPMIDSRRCGIYILEFANGERYVGQSVDLRARFAQHVHGSGHEPWTDIVAYSFVEVPEKDLNQAEAELIENQLGEGRKLRNRQRNLNYAGPCLLDKIISVEEQHHWASGKWELDYEAFVWGAERPLGGEPKLLKNKVGQQDSLMVREDGVPLTYAQAVLHDIAIVLTAIPEAVELERRYWTLSDCPSTAGGRFATLNVGALEVYAAGREVFHFESALGDSFDSTTSFINLPPGTVFEEFPEGLRVRPEWEEYGCEFSLQFFRAQYALTPTDSVVMPVGLVDELLSDPFIREPFQSLVLKLMRRGECGLFRRWHSEDLATLAYETLLGLFELAEEDGE